MLVTANVFQPLIDVFESVLKFLHDSGGISWGWSIVLLTIAVRALLVPLTFRQIKSMVRMQGLSPQMKEIQKKYKEDKPRQQQEMMKFYKENNVNPLGSCLPMVLQLPVFVSLYYMLRKSLRSDICPGVQTAYQKMYAAQHHLSSISGASGQTTACGAHGGSSFLFVHDLTAKATGLELAALIILYVGSQLGSSLLMSAASMDPTQRKIMMFMPLIFVLFVIRFPAGLLVYWITTNLWTVAQQYTVKRYIGPVQAVAVPAGGGGTAGVLTGSSEDGGGGSRSGGGMGARLRDRMAAAQASSAATQRERGASAGNGRSSAKSKSDSATVTKPSRSRSTPSKSGNGSSGNGSSSSGNGVAASGNGSGNRSSSGRASTPPPSSPRKKKKRSGRRR